MSERAQVLRATLIAGAAAAAAGALALVAPSPATPAVAAIQDDQLSSGSLEEIDARLPLLADTGTKVTRFDILWNQVALTPPAVPGDPNDPAYDWSRTDRIMCGLAQRNIAPIVTTFSTPPWAMQDIGAPLPDPNLTEVNPWRPRVGAYASWMRALATRYSGNFTPAVKDVTCTAPTLPRLRHFEIWNEPHIEKTFKPQSAAVPHYIKMVRAAYPAIRTANGSKGGRRAIVIAGVGAPRSTSNAQGLSALDWMRKILRSNAKFDAYSQHVYPGAAPRKPTKAIPAWATIPAMIDEIDRVKKRRGMKLYITEAGYTTGKGIRTGAGAGSTPAQQRLYLTQIFGLKVVKSPRIPVVMWFNLSDNVSWPGGILTEGLTRKPSYGAFVAKARASKVPAELRP